MAMARAPFKFCFIFTINFYGAGPREPKKPSTAMLYSRRDRLECSGVDRERLPFSSRPVKILTPRILNPPVFLPAWPSWGPVSLSGWQRPGQRCGAGFDVFMGFAGKARQGEWFPVTFEIFNDGPTFDGQVELRPRFGDVYRYNVELATNTRKRFTLPGFLEANSSWSAKLKKR
ncbi:MAG: hypothetical protein CM1200mP29_12040 [Verrucomicrobiota bacterium]|nr:MAG: hypothetical protein CM1200mP29_12040 [Verrucomicrobiota bacterium]